MQVARDRLAWAAKPIGKALTRQELLAEVAARFAAARTDLGKIVADFVKQRALQQEAQWDLANSFLTEARAVSAVSPTLARGQFVRAARELRAVAVKYPGHPQIGQIAPLLWDIAQEMENAGLRGRIGAGLERTGHLRPDESAGPAGHRQDRRRPIAAT